jgi:hypothetical protein
MSGRLVAEVQQYAPTDLRPLDFMVLTALAQLAKDTDRIARYGCGASQLAELVRPTSTPSSIGNALARLTSRGLIRPLLKARRGLHQEYEIARLAEHHRFAIHAEHGSTHRPDKRPTRAERVTA